MFFLWAGGQGGGGGGGGCCRVLGFWDLQRSLGKGAGCEQDLFGLGQGFGSWAQGLGSRQASVRVLGDTPLRPGQSRSYPAQANSTLSPKPEALNFNPTQARFCVGFVRPISQRGLRPTRRSQWLPQKFSQSTINRRGPRGCRQVKGVFIP